MFLGTVKIISPPLHIDHRTELPVIQLIVPTCVKLFKCNFHFLISQVLADGQELLEQIVITSIIIKNMTNLFSHQPIPILVHVLEQLFYCGLLPHELLKAQPPIKISVHGVKELLNLLPAMINNIRMTMTSPADIVVGTPEALRTCLHSSRVSCPSLFLSARVNIRRI